MANVLEGGRRISVVGSGALKISAALAVAALIRFALGFTDLSLYRPFQGTSILMAVCTAYSCGLAVIGGMLLLAGWIVRGFGAPTGTAATRSAANTTKAQVEA
jgi:hypothetical protein